MRTPKVVEDRREQIMDAAMRVFARKGFTRATNKNIADEIGITPGLIYHYFKNKKAMFQAIVETRSPLRIVRTLPKEALDLPPEQLLRFLGLRVLDVVEGESFVQILRMLLPEVLHNEEMRPILASALREVLEFIEHYLQTQMDKGTLRKGDALQDAQTVIGCIMGYVLRRQILHDPLALSYTQEQIVDSVVSTLFVGLLPR